MSGKAVPVGEPHEDHCSLAWTCDGICSCGPEGLRMQAEWSRAIRSEATIERREEGWRPMSAAQCERCEVARVRMRGRAAWRWTCPDCGTAWNPDGTRVESQPDWRAIAEELAAALHRAQTVMHDAYHHTGYIPASAGGRADGYINAALARYEKAKGKVGV